MTKKGGQTSEEHEAVSLSLKRLREENAKLKKENERLNNYVIGGYEQILDEAKKQVQELVQALYNISILEPYPDTEKNIRRSHAQHLKIANYVLSKHKLK